MNNLTNSKIVKWWVFLLFNFTILSANANAGQAEKHFHPKGKMPSKYTLEIFNQARKVLPFSDKQDFEERDRGFIAAPDYKK